MSYFFQAAAFDSSLLEASNRATIISANISGGNIGDNVRNDIQWRDEWIKRLTETEQYFAAGTMPYTLFYSKEIKQGEINYDNRTVTLSVDTNLRASTIWRGSLERTLRAVYDSLEATGRKKNRKLDRWPWEGVTTSSPFGEKSITRLPTDVYTFGPKGGAPGITPPNSKSFSVVAELVNSRDEVIGRQSLQAKGNWEVVRVESRDGEYPRVRVSDDDRKPLNSTNVNADKITDKLTIRFIGVNGLDAETAARDGILQIHAIDKGEFDEYSPLNSDITNPNEF